MNHEIHTVYLSLGSNMGDRLAILQEAVDHLPKPVRVSSVYETAPVGGVEQSDFLNIVAAFDTTMSPRECLEMARRLEQSALRERRVRWGPRTLDVDVLLVGDLVVDDEDLVVPHPRMFQRRFVLAPLAELAPTLVAPELVAESEGDVKVVGKLIT